MKERTMGCIWGGCLTFLAGIVAGAALTILALVGWALVRPIDLLPLTNQLEPGETDLEVILSEAFLNQRIATELADRRLENLARIIVDAQPRRRLEATLQGHFDLGGVLAPEPKVDAELQLGVEEGHIAVRIERMGVGPVDIVRENLPKLVEDLFEVAEETIEKAINGRILAEGFRVQEIRCDEDSLTLGLTMR